MKEGASPLPRAQDGQGARNARPEGATGGAQTTPRNRKRSLLLLVASVLGLALAIRFLNFPGVFHEEGVYLFGTDSYAHMRRIWLCAQHYPFVPAYDPYVNFPEGAISLWPPGFDFLLATVARIASPGAPVLRTTEAASALAIPFLGLVSILFAGRIARGVEGEGAGLLTMLLLALLPAHILPTRLGNVDHHVIELAVLTSLCALWVEAARRPERAPRVAVISGLLLGLAFAFWSGAHLFGLLLPIGFVAGATADAWRGQIQPTLAGAQRRFLLIAILAMIPFVLISPFSKGGGFTFMGVSWLHPLFLLLCFASLAASQFFLSRVARLPEERRGSALGLLLLLLLLAVALILFAPRFVPLLGQMVSYVRGLDPQAGFAAEAQPITAFPLAFTLHFFGLGLLLAIPALVLCLRGFDRTRVTLAAWALATGILALLQPVRLGSYFAIFIAILIACAASVLWRSDGARRATAILLVVLATLPGVLGFRVERRVETVDGNPWFPAIEEALVWMRENTPPTSGWEDTRVKPEYSVLAQWSYGNWINYIGRRPSVANPFGVAPWHLRGFEDSIRFMLSPDEEAADRIARARIARYVIATPILYTYIALARSIGAPTRAYATVENGTNRYRPIFFKLVANRLTLLDGGAEMSDADVEIPALVHYRMLFEGSAQTTGEYTPEGERVSTPERTSFVKVFERVEGARLRGHTLPLDRVQARIAVVTNQKREFMWTAWVRADAQGRFELQVPYDTQRARAKETGAEGPYLVTAGGREARVEVSPRAVVRGEAVQVVLAPW